jgi:hypothetical protein
MLVLSGNAHALATSAQYPQPARARTIAAVTETALATTSFFAIAEKCIARFNSAR